MDTWVSPLWSGLSHELTVMLLPAAAFPNHTLQHIEQQYSSGGVRGEALRTEDGPAAWPTCHHPSGSNAS